MLTRPDRLDAVNVFITLTARNLNRNLRIIARGEQPGFLDESLCEGDAVIILGWTHALQPILRAEVEREGLL